MPRIYIYIYIYTLAYIHILKSIELEECGVGETALGSQHVYSMKCGVHGYSKKSAELERRRWDRGKLANYYIIVIITLISMMSSVIAIDMIITLMIMHHML